MSVLSTFFSLAALGSFPQGELDWPRWRGPAGDNVSPETAWSSESSTAALFEVEIGGGYSSPVLQDGKLFIQGFFPKEEGPEGVDRVSCFDSESGQLLWSREYPALVYDNEHMGGSLSTASLADGVLYVPSRVGELRALKAEDGTLLWKVDLTERHDLDPGRYGFASSPYVSGDHLILNAGPTFKLTREEGETVWMSENADASYSTVAPIELDGQAGWVAFGGEGAFVWSDATGETLRQYVFRTSSRNVEGATPIVMGERVFLSSAYDHGGVLVDMQPEEPVALWRSRRMRTKMAGCTLHKGFLYGFDESMLKCLDLEGKERWRKRGLGQGALSIAGDRLLLTTSNGELIVAQANPEEYVEEFRRDCFEEGVFWTAPVLVNGLIYVRSNLGKLQCLDHRVGSDGQEGSGDGLLASLAPADSYTPRDLVRRHRRAVGWTEGDQPAFRMEGKMHNDALGLANVNTTWHQGGGRWNGSMDLPPGIGGTIERFFDGEIAWELNPYFGNKFIEGPELEELLATGGYRGLFEPCAETLQAKVQGPQRFRGVLCYSIDVPLDAERHRRVYFDAVTGLLAGRSAEGEATVHYADWRKVGGYLLPFARTHFDAELGQEWRWRFERGELIALHDDRFVLPEDLTR